MIEVIVVDVVNGVVEEFVVVVEQVVDPVEAVEVVEPVVEVNVKGGEPVVNGVVEVIVAGVGLVVDTVRVVEVVELMVDTVVCDAVEGRGN